jgi:putative Mg2+ transporter-C (MgtC) family protein
MGPLSVLVKLIFALVCGGIVGWQREARDRPAGLRTHVLVCLGATVYTLASMSFSSHNTDPSRVAAQVATGMGFLGAGTIIRHGNIVRGLTTAASLWAVAAIGLCVAIGGQAWWVAGMATVLVLLTLTVLRSFERVFVPRMHAAVLTLRLADAGNQIGAVRDALKQQGLRIDTLEVSRITPGGVQEMQVRMALPTTCDLTVLGPEIAKLEGFVSMRCE